jgi:hypothetical protein
MNGVHKCRHVSVGFTNEIRSERSEDQFVRPSLPRAVQKKDLDLDQFERYQNENTMR